MVDQLYPNKPVNTQGNAPAQPPAANDAVRLRILEDRYKNLSRREQLAEKNMLDFERELNTQIRSVQKRVTETRKHLSELNEKLDIMQGQVTGAAQKHDLQVLEAYLNILQPMQFATRTELKKLIEDGALKHKQD